MSRPSTATLEPLEADAGAPVAGRRPTALSGTATSCGQLLSPLLLGPLTDTTSITTGFLATAGLAALVMLVLLTTDLTPRADLLEGPLR